MHLFCKSALTRFLTLPDYSRGPEFLKSSEIVDLQNEDNTLVARQFLFGISVQMG